MQTPGHGSVCSQPLTCQARGSHNRLVLPHNSAAPDPTWAAAADGRQQTAQPACWCGPRPTHCGVWAKVCRAGEMRSPLRPPPQRRNPATREQQVLRQQLVQVHFQQRIVHDSANASPNSRVAMRGALCRLTVRYSGRGDDPNTARQSQLGTFAYLNQRSQQVGGGAG